MSRCLYVSYYTPDYADVARRLVDSLNHFKLDHQVLPMSDRGSWAKNCAQKPSFLMCILDRFAGDRPVVWLDADAAVKRSPVLFESASSPYAAGEASPHMGVCRYKWKRARKTEILSGTIWLRRSMITESLLRTWHELCLENETLWDQMALAKAIDKTWLVHVRCLPVEYCFIHDFHREEHPGRDPVVEHFQHSRVTRQRRRPDGEA